MTAALTTRQEGLGVDSSSVWAGRIVWGAALGGLAIWGVGAIATEIGHRLDNNLVQEGLNQYQRAAIEAASTKTNRYGSSDPTPATHILVDGKEVGTLYLSAPGTQEQTIRADFRKAKWMVANAIDESDKIIPEVCVKDENGQMRCIGAKSQIGAWFDATVTRVRKFFTCPVSDIDWRFWGAAKATPNAPLETGLYAKASSQPTPR